MKSENNEDNRNAESRTVSSAGGARRQVPRQKEQCERDPVYGEVYRRMKEKTLEPGVATDYQMDISQKKGVLVSLQQTIRTEKQPQIILKT